MERNRERQPPEVQAGTRWQVTGWSQRSLVPRVTQCRVFRLIPGAGGAWPPSESARASCGGAGCRVSEKGGAHRPAAWDGSEPLLPPGSLSSTPHGSLPHGACVREVRSLLVCARAAGRTGPWSPAQAQDTPGAAVRAREQAVPGWACRRLRRWPARSFGPCLPTTGVEDATAWKVCKTSRCLSPWRPDSLHAVGTLPQEPPVGAGVLAGPRPGPAAAVSCPGVSCSASSGSSLGGEGGGSAEVTAASPRRSPLQALPGNRWSPLPSAQGAGTAAGGRRRPLGPGSGFASCAGSGRSSTSLSRRRPSCEVSLRVAARWPMFGQCFRGHCGPNSPARFSSNLHHLLRHKTAYSSISSVFCFPAVENSS